MTDQPSTRPGWYPDPEDPARLRWWDGDGWTSQYTTAPGAPGSGPAVLPDISQWVRTTLAALWHRSGQLVALALVLGLVPALLLAAASWAAVGDIAFVDGDVVGWDRGVVVPLVLSLALYVVATLAFAQGAIHQILAALTDRPVPWQRSIAPGLRSLLRLLGYVVVLVVAALGFTAVVTLIGIGVPALLVVIVPALLVAAVWLYVKLSFVAVAAVASDRGVNLLRTSAALSSGRFWAVLGRLVVLALLGVAAGFAFNIVTIPLQATASIDASVIETVDGELSDFAVRDVVPNVGVLGVLLVVATLVQSAQSAVGAAGHAALYRDAGGPSGLLHRPDDDEDRGPTSPIIE